LTNVPADFGDPDTHIFLGLFRAELGRGSGAAHRPRRVESGGDDPQLLHHAAHHDEKRRHARHKGRYDQMAPAIRQDFDLLYMARMAVGPAWRQLSDDQKKQVGDAFARYMIATYADNFDGYSGEKFEVTGQQTNPVGTIVQSRIVKSNGETVSMNYLMREDQGAWRVDDIYLSGTISQLATLRSQFVSVLERDGADGLIASLNRKAETLIASVVP
jgi:phospholipid transport system substrate-binding protein